MTKSLYKKLQKEPRREPLERSYITVKKIDTTQVSNNAQTIVEWNVIVQSEAKSVDKKVEETEDWYLVSLVEENGVWKVDEVNINVPS